VVVGIQRASGKMEFNPSPESVMGAGDFLVVLGQASTLRELEAAATSSGSTRVPEAR
jgi:K+/H+ antiporter YhaU regulatory subunit KhtT